MTGKSALRPSKHRAADDRCESLLTSLSVTETDIRQSVDQIAFWFTRFDRSAALSFRSL